LENDLEITRISDECLLGHRLHLSYDDGTRTITQRLEKNLHRSITTKKLILSCPGIWIVWLFRP